MNQTRAFLRHFFSNLEQQWYQLTSHQQRWVLAGAAGGIFIIVAFIAFLSSERFSEQDTVDPAYQAYISSFSAGVLSTESPVRVQLTYPVADSAQVGQLVRSRLFRFNPEVDGRAYWVDQSTVEFIPDEPLQNDQSYQVKFDLDELIDVPKAYQSFQFSFQTIEQNYSVELLGLTAGAENEFVRQQVQGTLLTADAAEASAIEGILVATQNEQQLPIRWEHSTDQRSHAFTVDDVVRRENEGEVVITSSGEPIAVSKAQSFELKVPPLSRFELLGYRVIDAPEQYLELRFSDPLQPEQNLSGLIQLRPATEGELRYVIDKNVVKVYPSERLFGPATIIVNEGVRNARSDAFPSTVEVDVQFEAVKPAVRVVHSGVILPTTKGMVLPIEAVNLRAVDVTVVRVFEKSVFQFFQVNQYDGKQEIRRVGQPVVQQEIPLNGSGATDLGKWNRFTLDLGKIIEAEPGALYQVNIGFRQKHSLYGCLGEVTSLESSRENADNWNNPDYMYRESYGEYYYASNYNWEERDNPCSPSYYGGRRSVQKNLVVSDLGLLAKMEGDNRYRFTVTDLQTTEPQSGVTIELYDLQQQLIAEGTTDSDGWWEAEPEKRPFLAVAEREGQRSYLRLDDGNALSLSNFDVVGQSVEAGIKGFLYGDRGVWRPGDSLHINFILEDETGRLPEYHPVIFELTNPRGQLARRIVRTDGVGGIYNFSTATAADALTGNWLAKVQVGGADFTQTVRIETIKPNRLRADLDLGVSRLTSRNQRVTADLSVEWLNGATARNLRAQYDLLLTPRSTTFTRFPNYVFDDPAVEFVRERREVFDGRINSDGEASFRVDLSTEGPVPGMLNATFIGKIFEEGGNFSTDQLTLPYYPYSSYVGIRVPEGEGWAGALTSNQTHNIAMVVADAEGDPVSRQDLEVDLYELDWRWWWDQSGRSLAQYVNETYYQPIQSATVDAPQGQANWELSVEDATWGRYLLRVCDPVSEHCTGKLIYLDSPYATNDRDRSEGATMLTFTSDKDTYLVGVEATLYLPSQTGRALVSLENGSRVIENFWVTLDEETEGGEAATDFTFEITEAMVPNVYAHVTMLQPHEQTTNDLPIRMYGILNLDVENSATRLQPIIDIPSQVAPESEVTFRVSEANEQEMAYTVAIVDEGLLDITNFATPEPHDYFYAREALGVKTWDLYNYVIGAYGGELERLLAVGGDEALLGEGQQSANRFSPVVKFLGPFYLDDDEVNEHTFTMPNYVGSVRVMVVGAYEGAYGSADTTATVSQSLMVLGTMPRVLGLGEKIQLPVSVFAMDNSVKDVRVSLNTNALVINQETRSQDLFFPVTGDRVIDFSVITSNEVGVVTVQIDAASGPKRASYDISIDVRNPNSPVTQAVSQLIKPGQTWNAAYEAVGIPNTNQAVLEVSSIPPLNLGQRLAYLTQYPHGCIEQTVSAAFPQLYLSQIEELDEAELNRVENNVRAAIYQLNSFATNEGGFAYWPESQDADEWSTSYAGHFLLEAQQQGYSVPAGLLRSWANYQQRRATQWGAGSGYTREELVQSYRLYSLALAGEPAQGAMNRMRERGELSLLAKWRLAAAYTLIEQEEVANQMIRGLETSVPDYQENYGTFGSALRDEAMILETLTLLGKTELGLRLYEQISAALADESRWMSTQTTGFCLIAASKYAKTVFSDQEIQFAFQPMGRPTSEVRSIMTLVQRPLDIETGRQYTTTVTNQSQGDLYARVVLRGVPPVSENEAQENGLRLQINYKGTDGESIDPNNVLQGTDFLAEITVYNPGTQGDVQQIALTHIIPSGWEIINTRLQGMSQFYQQSPYEYQDIRDDRVYTYFDLSAGERKTFIVVLNAAYAGRFYQPGVYCEAMYDNTLSARSEGNWVEVQQP